MRDALLLLGTEQTINASASHATTNAVNMAAAGKHYGLGGRQLFMHFLVTTTFGGLDSGTRLQVVMDDAEAISSPTILLETPIILPAALVAGAHFVLPIFNPNLSAAGEQYVAGYFAKVSENASAGKISTWIDDVPN